MLAPFKESYILMCKDYEVYDIDNSEVLDSKLCPSLVANKRLLDWRIARSVSNTNSKMKSRFRNKTKLQIFLETLGVSMSDHYWFKPKKSNYTYEKIHPRYNNDYIKSLPTLPGYKTKEWLDISRLYKEDSIEDYYAYQYLKALGIKSQTVNLYNDGSTDVVIYNFTDSDIFLEQADMTTNLDRNNYKEQDIIDIYGYKLGYLKEVYTMFLVDALLDNTDRHLGNFGLLKSVDSNFEEFAPLYDFDNALSVYMSEDIYDTDLFVNCESNIKKYLVDILYRTINLDDTFYLINKVKARAIKIYKQLN